MELELHDIVAYRRHIESAKNKRDSRSRLPQFLLSHAGRKQDLQGDLLAPEHPKQAGNRLDRLREEAYTLLVVLPIGPREDLNVET